MIFPRKYWISFLFLGEESAWIDETLMGSMTTPSIEIIWLSNFPSLIVSRDFLGLGDIPNFLHI